MKKVVVFSLFLLAVWGQLYAAQPVRTPFVELFIEGERILNGAEIKVNKGQRFTLFAQIKGGRADFVQLPDTYADLGDGAKIISRNYNKLIYEKNGVTHKWEMIDENIDLETDTKIRLLANNELENKKQTDVFIPVDKVEKTYIKVKITSTWQYSNGTTSKTEQNTAEALIHLDIQGNTNVWFASPNIRAAGTEDKQVKEYLLAIQDSYNKIESLLNTFEFTSMMSEIQQLRSTVGQLESRIEYLVANEPTKHSDIFFVGLPSDKAISDIDDFRSLANAWSDLEKLVQEHQVKLNNLTKADDKLTRRNLLSQIKPFTSWEEALPGNSESLLTFYAKDFNWENTSIRSFLAFNPAEERINNIEQSLADYQRYLSNRQENMEAEKQKIQYALTRLQAVRIFDGMLMGFFSSLNFARWENTRN